MRRWRSITNESDHAIEETVGQISQITRPNGVVSDWAYDSAGRVDRIDHTGPGGGGVVILVPVFVAP